jgi:predicted nucleic acid-binding protein
MTIVDTSVWIDHLRKGNPIVKKLLNNSEVLIHPFIIGELACGNLKNRPEILRLLDELPKAVVAENAEVLQFVERKHLFGLGIGWIDVHLLASVMLSRSTMLTYDKSLEKAYKKLGVAKA